jgi:sec-independent protein translocase protein TatA
MGPGFATNPFDLLILLLFAFLVLGPKRLPEVGRMLGRGVREARRSLSALSLDAHADDTAGAEPYASTYPVEAVDPDPASVEAKTGRGRARELDTIG